MVHNFVKNIISAYGGAVKALTGQAANMGKEWDAGANGLREWFGR